ncbi:MAG: XRE family transcriptional regulator [Candidatus Latescibacterota bacterium]
MKPKSDLPELGKNIAIIRKSRNFSLEELSKRSGVSIGMLSQIEQEKVNPTVAVVWKIAYGLDVPFHELLATNENKELFNLIRRNEAVIMERDEGRCIFRIVSPLSMAEKLELYTLQLHPEGVLESQAHSTDTEEFITVFTGRVEVEVNGRQAILDPGDSIHYHTDVNHTIRNMHDGDSILYMVVKYLY